jgi:hypothetical protein
VGFLVALPFPVFFALMFAAILHVQVMASRSDVCASLALHSPAFAGLSADQVHLKITVLESQAFVATLPLAGLAAAVLCLYLMRINRRPGSRRPLLFQAALFFVLTAGALLKFGPQFQAFLREPNGQRQVTFFIRSCG